jgi:hypothetical protein
LYDEFAAGGSQIPPAARGLLSEIGVNLLDRVPPYARLSSLTPMYVRLSSLTPMYVKLSSLTPMYVRLSSLTPSRVAQRMSG